MQTAVIVDAVRSASGRGKPGGALSGLHPVDLYAQVLKALVERTGVPKDRIDDVISGCVSQAGEQASNLSRAAALAAGLPMEVPGTTVDRQCGSSQQAVHFAAQGVMSGAYDIVIAGGVESMSRVPMGTARLGVDPRGEMFNARYPDLVNQGVAAELIATRWGLDRESLDAYSARSHQRAATVAAQGGFDNEIVAVDVPGADGSLVQHRLDETIRPATTPASLAGLRPSFQSETLSERFPEISWKITPGNSSPLTDGAAALLVMSEGTAAELGLRPRARFVSFSVVGSDPLLMLTGPIPATQRVLQRAGMKVDEIDAFEVNEAFAPVPLAFARELGVDEERLNPSGGAIALGHALGGSGARLMTTMLNHLEQTGGRYGLQTMCEGGGMANATLIERLG